MSGAGQFRGARSRAVQEHLGDRLAAFVDGELRDDVRDRVLAHLATCDPCRAEAEEQRRLKTAVADSIQPALSAGLLARLQCLPEDAGGPSGGPRAPGPRGGFGRGGFGADVLGGPRGTARSYLAPPGEPLDGFPIHDLNRPASRGRRLAFAAAGAFSLAALALGATLPLEVVLEGGGPPEATPGSVSTPMSMSRPAGRDTGSQPGLVPLSAVVAKPPAGSPAGRTAAAPAARVEPRNPSPSALPAAGPVPGRGDGQGASVAAAPATFPADPSSSAATSPTPVPLLGDVGAPVQLSAPLPGGHVR